MLQLKNIMAGYIENNFVLNGLNLQVSEGEIVGILGQNGCGKSTLAKFIMGMLPYMSGNIIYKGEEIAQFKTHEISGLGIGYFPQGGKVFPNLTVSENMEFASGRMEKSTFHAEISKLQGMFSILKSESKKGSELSGGDRHQLALAMILLKQPKFLILDEPSAGLSPANVEKIYAVLSDVRQSGIKSMLIIEQNAMAAIKLSDRMVYLENGKIAREAKAKDLKSPKEIDKFFFGKI